MRTICELAAREAESQLEFHAFTLYGSAAVCYLRLHRLRDHTAHHYTRHGAIWSILLGRLCRRGNRGKLAYVFRAALAVIRLHLAVAPARLHGERSGWVQGVE